MECRVLVEGIPRENYFGLFNPARVIGEYSVTMVTVTDVASLSDVAWSGGEIQIKEAKFGYPDGQESQC